MHTQISVKDLTDEDIYRTLRTCIDSIGGALRPDFDGITVTDAYVDEDISGIEIVLTDEAGVELHAILQLTGRWIEALMSTTTINTLLADSIEPLRGISPGVAYYLRGSKR